MAIYVLGADPMGCTPCQNDYTCTGIGDDCTNKTHDPDQNAYTCVGTGDDCTNKTHQSDFAVGCTQPATYDCSNLSPGAQAAYAADAAAGPAVGTFNPNKVPPILRHHAFLGCRPDTVSISLTRVSGILNGNPKTINYNNVIFNGVSSSRHYISSAGTLISDINADWASWTITSVVLAWTAGAPDGAHQIKGKAY